MASPKSSSSRPLPSGVCHPNGGSTMDIEVQLADKLKIFKTENFDLDSYVHPKCQAKNDKEIRAFCSKKASAEEMRKSIYANYAPFIRASKEISDLEGELLLIRYRLSIPAALIHGLSDGVQIDSLSNGPYGFSQSQNSNIEDTEPFEIQKLAAEFSDMLSVLLAERIDNAEKVILDTIQALRTSISEHRQKLAEQLVEAACQSSTRGIDLGAASSALKGLEDGPTAHSLLLNAHDQRLQFTLKNIHPTSTSYGGAYTAALSEEVFSVINQALTDSIEFFGNESCYTSKLEVWSTRQAENFAKLINRHALGSCAASGRLGGAAKCMQIAFGHCALLEARGLSLSSVLLKLFRPSVEQVLGANLKRIEESTAALAAADDWSLTIGADGNVRESVNGLASQPKLTSSAHGFNSMVQDLIEDVGPLLSLQLVGSIMDGLLKVFNSYIDLLISVLPNATGENELIVRPAETEYQQLALLVNACLLAEELLPRAAAKLYQAGTDETREKVPRRNLEAAADRLTYRFCIHHAFKFIKTADGERSCIIGMYDYMDRLAIGDIVWSPSLIFQDLYAKLLRMANLAKDMFVGRERFVRLLMMKIIEHVLFCISRECIFFGRNLLPRRLGRNVLKQFVLLSSEQQGWIFKGRANYFVLKNIERAADGLDSDHSDELFIEIAQNTITMIRENM